MVDLPDSFSPKKTCSCPNSRKPLVFQFPVAINMEVFNNQIRSSSLHSIIMIQKLAKAIFQPHSKALAALPGSMHQEISLMPDEYKAGPGPHPYQQNQINMDISSIKGDTFFPIYVIRMAEG